MRPDGRFEAKGVCPKTGKRKSYYSRFSQEEANKKASDSYGIKPDKTLWSFYVRAYLPACQHKTLNTRKAIAWAMDNYILPAFGSRNIDEITRAELQRYFNNVQGMKASSIRQVKLVFSGVMTLAEQDEMIRSNPVRLVRLPPVLPPIKQAVSASELFRILEELRSRPVFPFVVLCACGLRAGEALGVMRSNIKGGVLEVRHQMQKGKLVPTKTPQSNRDVPLPQTVREMLEGESVFVCQDVGLKTASRDLAKFGITPHELRHTFISILENELEVPAPVVARLAGKVHQGATVGYSHATSQQMAKAMERYWSLIEEAGKKTGVRLA